MKILCVFGKYQYGNKNRGINTEYFSFIPSLKSLNHKIIFFDSWDRDIYDDFIQLNQALINVVNNERPDIIFSVQLGYEIWIETWDYIRFNFKCKTINWCTDDSWKYKEHSKFLACHFDLMVTTYSEFLDKYKSQNANAFLSGWGVPIQWVKKPIQAKECKYKVSFIGASHGVRKEKIKELQKHGIDVECFGYGWNNGVVDADDIPKIFNQSIISLNFANSSGDNQIKARVFEVTGSGGCLFTENATNLDKSFNDDEIVVFDDMQDCADKIKFYLANYDKRDLIAKNGFNKISQNYTYANRLEEILQYVETIKVSNVNNVCFDNIMMAHKNNLTLNVIKYILIFIGRILFKKDKAFRFARRVVYEFSWRFLKENTYKSKGVIGRMFYRE